MDRNILPQRITKERERLDWPKVKLGEYLGVKGQTIGKYEKGLRQPDIEMAIKMSELFGCSVDYLYGLSDVRFIEDPEIEITEPEIKKVIQEVTAAMNEAEKRGYITEQDKINFYNNIKEDVEFMLYKKMKKPK
jgi:DNA-binding XRE family transcriptional regulator